MSVVITTEAKPVELSIEGCAPTLGIDESRAVFLTVPAEQGIAGSGESARKNYVAGAVVSGHKAAIVTADGTAIHADSTQPSHAGALIGLTITAAVAGSATQVVASDAIDFEGWSFTPDQPVFVGANGDIAQTLPAGAVFSQVIGWARSPTRLLLSIQPPVFI